MRWLTLVFVALIVLLQYPLWFGKGGWLKVWDYQRQLIQLKEANHKLEVRNAGLDAEVRDLKQGYEAIEERARFELGLIKEGEVFVQLPEQNNAQAAPSAPPSEPLPTPTASGAPRTAAPARR
jgi:cell division protein FtsB